MAGQIVFGPVSGKSRSQTTFSSRRESEYRSDSNGDDARCRATEGAPTTIGSGSPSTSPSGGAPSGSGQNGGTMKNDGDLSIVVDPSLANDPRPSVQIFRTELGHEVWRDDVSIDVPPHPAGEEIAIKLWAMKPIDWGGVVLEISRFEIRPNDEVAWRAKLESQQKKNAEGRAENARVSKESSAKWSAHLQECSGHEKEPQCADVARARAPYVPQPQTSTGTPPPAPKAETKPPKPSDGAIWVAGSWVWDGFKWSYWSPGFWNVPPSDVAGKHTATAPSAPPAPKTESKPPQPVPNAVWTPGYWHWQMSAWVWVDGAWRVPPSAGAKWKPAEWRVEAGGVVRLDPGGWVTP
jgi:hypothetical protein